MIRTALWLAAVVLVGFLALVAFGCLSSLYRVCRHMFHHHWPTSKRKCDDKYCALHDPAATAAWEAYESLFHIWVVSGSLSTDQKAELERLRLEWKRVSTLGN
jgi:hypothetical protein